MSPLANNPFIVSRIPVLQNAFKNILFRGATLILTFVLYRFFALVAFRREDYTSFLMFAEDVFQKCFFVQSRRFNRQTLLVISFAGLTVVAGFYDTLLWAVDSPGYVIKSTRVNATVLTKQMVEAPAYITFITGPKSGDLNSTNIQDIFGANLFSPRVNFTLPGIIGYGKPQPLAPLQPLASHSVSPRIWLDSTGFAVGLDDTIMMVADMNATTFCGALNLPPDNASTPVTTQAWICPLRNIDAEAVFEKELGVPKYWWNANTSDFFLPRRLDNPWFGISQGGDTGLMKQLFSVTKGLRRHTFLQTTLKATMIALAPMVFSDADVKDFITRAWGQTMQTLVDKVLLAQNNQTSFMFGVFVQQDEETVMSYSTNYLYVTNPVDETPMYSALTFASTVISLAVSETLPTGPSPLTSCNGSATNIAIGGVVRRMSCVPAPVGSNTSTQPQFLGQLDTMSVLIITNILGDGTQSTSAGALNDDGLNWWKARDLQMDYLLASRAMIMTGYGSHVVVDVQTNEAAISYFQLILTILPIFLALIVMGMTFKKPMSYYESSFLAAVFATAHASSDKPDCKKVGYMRFPPEIVLKTKGGQVSLQTKDGELVIVPGGRAPDSGMVFEPFIMPEKEKTRTIISETAMLLADEENARDIDT